MDLDEYLWKKKLNQKVFADLIGVTPTCISYLRKKLNSPTLLTAIKIHLQSNGEIALSDLLCEKEASQLINFKKALE